MSSRMTTALKKKLLIKAMADNFGIVTKACQACGIDRATYYHYFNKDAKFKAAVEDVAEICLDAVEASIYEQIQDKVPSSTIFYLKTKGSRRGYVEPQQEEKDSTDMAEVLKALVDKLPK